METFIQAGHDFMEAFIQAVPMAILTVGLFVILYSLARALYLTIEINQDKQRSTYRKTDRLFFKAFNNDNVNELDDLKRLFDVYRKTKEQGDAADFITAYKRLRDKMVRQRDL